jgi:hypothetical protein
MMQTNNEKMTKVKKKEGALCVAGRKYRTMMI